MSWNKRGLVYTVPGDLAWARHTVLTPTPFLLDPDRIRIYAGFRDDAGVSRIGYLDVRAEDPADVLEVSRRPLLDIGEPGMFDDNGLLLGDVIRTGKEIRMYYVGFQLPGRVKFHAFSGLAVSHDGGHTFERFQPTPVLDRAPCSPHIRAIHTVLPTEKGFLVYYSIGDGWEPIDCVSYPRYRICVQHSLDGVSFASQDPVCVDVEGAEYRIGRPRVWQQNGRFHMLYTSDTVEKVYANGYAVSEDGYRWRRAPSDYVVPRSATGWDSEMACYPVPLFWNDRVYAFYSGNGMGRTGLGYAVWEND